MLGAAEWEGVAVGFLLAKVRLCYGRLRLQLEPEPQARPHKSKKQVVPDNCSRVQVVPSRMYFVPESVPAEDIYRRNFKYTMENMLLFPYQSRPPRQLHPINLRLPSPSMTRTIPAPRRTW